MRLFTALILGGVIAVSLTNISVAEQAESMFETPLPNNQHPEFLEGALIAGEVGVALDREDFATIDTMAKTFLDQDAKTSAGTWKIGYLNNEFAIQEITDEYPFIHEERLIQKWIKAAPQSPTAHIAYATNVISHGFFFLKGHRDPSPEEQKIFDGYIMRARHILEDCRRICDNEPDWYARMLQVAKIQDWKENRFGRLFAEASGKFPYYQGLYFEGAEYYSPFHGRTFEDLDQFVQDAIGKTSKTEGTIFYARIYSYMAHRMGYDCRCLRLSYPRMYNALLELNNRYRDLRNAHEFAWIACVFGDKITMKMLLPDVLDPPPWDIWDSQEVLDTCKSWAVDDERPPGISPLLPPPPPAPLPAPPGHEAKPVDSI